METAETQFTSLMPAQVRSLCTLVHAAAKGDEAIGSVHLAFAQYGERIRMTATATDRYRVAELVTDLHPEAFSSAPTEGFQEWAVTVKRVQIERLAKAAGAGRRFSAPRPSVIVSTDEKMVTFGDETAGWSIAGEKQYGDYPSVARFMPEHEQAAGENVEISLKPSFLATLDKLRLPNHQGAEATWKMFPQGLTETGRVKPIYFTIHSDNGDMLRYLLQPNIPLR